MGYRAPAGAARAEHEIQKSRFIGIALPVTTPEEAASAITGIEKEFPDATHHCWAYVLGNPESSPRMRMHDAGEPAGTAGKPILNVLQQRKVGDVLLVVVRYFGGVKLGAGGLVRAYTKTAARAMDSLQLVTVTARVEARFHFDYPDERVVRRLLEELGVELLSTAYGRRVEFTIRLPSNGLGSVGAELSNRTGGRVKLETVADCGS